MVANFTKSILAMRLKEKLNFHLRNKIRISKNNELTLGKGSQIRQCHIIIKGSGNKLIIESGAKLRKVKIEIDGENCQLRIGKNTVIGENCYLSAREKDTQLIIGANCMFSRNVKVMTSDGHNIIDVSSKRRINLAKNILIEDHVWLADGAVVLKGCKIGSGAVIGLHSIVTQNISNNTVAAGIPAKSIKENTTWENDLTY